jgi:hypothetical protein
METGWDSGILKKLRVGKDDKILIINAPESYLALLKESDLIE